MLKHLCHSEKVVRITLLLLKNQSMFEFKKESCNEVHRLVLLDIIYATNNIMDIGIWNFLKAQNN